MRYWRIIRIKVSTKSLSLILKCDQACSNDYALICVPKMRVLHVLFNYCNDAKNCKHLTLALCKTLGTESDLSMRNIKWKLKLCLGLLEFLLKFPSLVTAAPKGNNDFARKQALVVLLYSDERKIYIPWRTPLRPRKRGFLPMNSAMQRRA